MKNKPIIVAKEDFENGLKELINNSNLPLVILQPIIKSLYNEISISYAKQYREEKEKYELEMNSNAE